MKPAHIKPVQPVNGQLARTRCLSDLLFSMMCTVACSGQFHVGNMTFKFFALRREGRASCVGNSVAMRNEERLGAVDCFDGAASVYVEPYLVEWVRLPAARLSLFRFFHWIFRFGDIPPLLLPGCLFQW